MNRITQIISFISLVFLFAFTACQDNNQQPEYVQEFESYLENVTEDTEEISRETWNEVEKRYNKFEEMAEKQGNQLSEEARVQVDQIRKTYRDAKIEVEYGWEKTNASVSKEINEFERYLAELEEDAVEERQETWNETTAYFEEVKEDIDKNMDKLNDEVKSEWDTLEQRYNDVKKALSKEQS